LLLALLTLLRGLLRLQVRGATTQQGIRDVLSRL
jgi:hypothetical protein